MELKSYIYINKTLALSKQLCAKIIFVVKKIAEFDHPLDRFSSFSSSLSQVAQLWCASQNQSSTSPRLLSAVFVAILNAS